jgi:ParB/RepB/Spo0J family partition protein
MTTTTSVASGRQRIALERIAIPENVRELDTEHVDALAASVKLRGLLVPVIVRPLGGENYELIAGFHRFAAHQKLRATHIDAEVHAGDSEHADRAIENVARKQLDPYEEARAVHAMLADGLTEDGAAQALGWPRVRVTARVKLLELPERAQRLVGAGTIPLGAVDQLRAINHVSPPLLDAVIDFVADGNEWAAERLAREPGWVLDSALRQGRHKAFAAHLTAVDAHDADALRLGKKTDVLVEEAAALYKHVDRYGYRPLAFRFSDAQIDQARAAGVVIEFERSAPIIVDRAVYRELAKDAIKAGVEQLREQAAAAEAERKRARVNKSTTRAADPLADAQREEARALREIAEHAHGANLDLGASLLNGLATVDPTDIDVARFFVFALLGADYDHSPYTQLGERVARLAVNGIRLVIGDFRIDVTKTRSDGSRGRRRIDYGDAREKGEPIAWLWKWIDGACSAGELYGRTLVVIAAEQYASRLVIPQSQRVPATRWASHNDLAAKALRKLAGPHLPASLKQLDRAIARAHREHDNTVERHHRETHADTNAPAATEHDDVADVNAREEARAGEVSGADEKELREPSEAA